MRWAATENLFKSDDSVFPQPSGDLNGFTVSGVFTHVYGDYIAMFYVVALRARVFRSRIPVSVTRFRLPRFCAFIQARYLEIFV